MRRKGKLMLFLGLGIIAAGTLVFATGENHRPGNRDKKAKREERVKGKAPRFFEGIQEETVKEGVPPRGVSKYTYVTVRQVTTSSNHDRQPSWSPDGQEIVFISSSWWQAASCCKINQDGTGFVLLGQGYADFGTYACYRMPIFSPDGSKILYSLYDSTLWRGAIWMMNSDGSGKQRVSPFDFTDCRSRPGACWSNDGNTVYYRYHYDGHLYSCRVGTGIEVNLTSGFVGIHGCRSSYSEPKVSPDGEWILFRNWNWDPAIVDTSGTTYIVIDSLRGDARRQDWSPDGSKIVYESDRLWSGDMDLWIANSNGTGQAPLLQSDNACFIRPAWSPDGKWITYLRRNRWFWPCTVDVWVTSIDGLYQGNLSCQYDTAWACRSTPEWNSTGDRIVFDAISNSSDMDIYVIDLDTGDDDLDLLLNWEEEVSYKTSPNNPDTDGGGEEDGCEIANGRDPLNPSDDVAVYSFVPLHIIGWNSIALPVLPCYPDPNACFSDDISPVTLYGFDEPTNSYYAPTDLMMGRGYLLGCWAAGCTLDVSGTPVALPYTIFVTKTFVTPYYGWNLVGNPTIDTINFDNLIFDNVNFLYKYFNGYGYEFYPGGGMSNFIPPWMGFWVQAINPGLGSITVPSAVKGEDVAIEYDFRIRLDAVSGSLRDIHNYISITDDDRVCDVFEFVLPLSEYIMLYFPKGGVGYQQLVFDKLDGALEIPVEVEVNTDNPTVTLSWEFTGDVSGYEITLTDGSTVVDMTKEGSYTFENTFVPDGFTEPDLSDPVLLLSRKALGEIRHFTLKLSPGMGIDVMPQGRTYLESVLPNPATNYTEISFSLARKGKISLIVYDVSGRHLQTIAEGSYSEGIHSIKWDTSKLNPGTYLVKFQAEGYTETEKVIIVR